MPTLTAPGHGSLTALTLTAMGPLLNAPSRDRQMPMPPSPRGSSKTRAAEVQSRVQSGLLLSLSNTGFSIGHPPTISVDADAERVRTPVAD